MAGHRAESWRGSVFVCLEPSRLRANRGAYHEIVDHQWNPSRFSNAECKRRDGGANAGQPYAERRAILQDCEGDPFAPGYGVPRVPPGVYLPNIQRGVDVGRIISGMLGSSLPPQYAQIVRNAVRVSASHRSSGSYESPGSYDFSTPSPTIDVDNSQSQAAIDASDQAIQQEDQSLQDLDASVAAAEQQNDAANAAAVQTDINAGM